VFGVCRQRSLWPSEPQSVKIKILSTTVLDVFKLYCFCFCCCWCNWYRNSVLSNLSCIWILEFNLNDSDWRFFGAYYVAFVFSLFFFCFFIIIFSWILLLLLSWGGFIWEPTVARHQNEWAGYIGIWERIPAKCFGEFLMLSPMEPSSRKHNRVITTIDNSCLVTKQRWRRPSRNSHLIIRQVAPRVIHTPQVSGNYVLRLATLFIC